jgi:hypothetical protein
MRPEGHLRLRFARMQRRETALRKMLEASPELKAAPDG